MSTSSLSAPDAIARDQNEGQDFDPRTYISVVLSWWKEILLLAFLAAATAGVGVLLQEQLKAPQYEAVADIVTVRLVSQVALDDRMIVAGETDSDVNSVNRRREAMTRLAASGVVAEAVISELGDQLNSEEQDPNALIEMVEVESPATADGRNPSDMIRIRVTAGDPEKAAAIANSWAKHYIVLVNTVFGQVPPELFESVEAERLNASDQHETAQKALEERIATSQVDRLQNEINLLMAQRTVLETGRDRVLATVAEQDRAARLQFFTELTDAQAQAHIRVFRSQSQSNLNTLTNLYADRDLADRYLDMARSLSEQIAIGGDSAVATNQQTLQLLKNQIYTLPDYTSNADGTTSDTPLAPTFTFITDSAGTLPSAEDLASDADAVVAALEQHVAALGSRIEEVSQSLLAGDDYLYLDQISAETLAGSSVLTPTQSLADGAIRSNELSAAIQRSYSELFDIGDMVRLSQLGVPDQNALTSTLEQLDAKIQSLRAELAAEETSLQRLTEERDLAWTAFSALSRKAVELGIEQSAATTDVRLGSPAIPPSKSVPGPSLIVTTALAWAVGLLLAVFLALTASYLGYRPIL